MTGWPEEMSVNPLSYQGVQGSPPIAEICQRIVAAIKPEKVFLFGSYAWGTPHQDSDVDVFVIVSASDQPAYRRSRDVYRCLSGITFPVDVIVQTHDEVDRSSKVVTSLSRKVLEQGTMLYG